MDSNKTKPPPLSRDLDWYEEWGFKPGEIDLPLDKEIYCSEIDEILRLILPDPKEEARIFIANGHEVKEIVRFNYAHYRMNDKPSTSIGTLKSRWLSRFWIAYDEVLLEMGHAVE